MSTKPTDTGRWAVDGSDVDATNIIIPTSGQRDVGYTTNAVPTSGGFNYLENIAYRWRKYLSDGNLSGKITIGGQPLAFTDFVYTANSGTDQLAKTAHGLQTGDGPLRTSNSGGGLPGGLAAGTDYYAIFDDADHFKVALTRAQAFDGTFVDLTTNGTGTQTLLHQSGTTRVDDVEVTRNLIVGGNAAIARNLTIGGETYGVRKKQFVPESWLASGTAPTLVTNPAGGGVPVNVWNIPTAQTVRTRIPVEEGDIVTSIDYEVYGDGAVDWIGTVIFRASLDGSGGASLASNGGGVTNQAATWTMSSLPTTTTEFPMPSGAALYAQVIVSGGTQLYLGSITVGVKRIPLA